MWTCRFQSADPEDPWLQLEWGKILIHFNQTTMGIRHLEAAASLFVDYLAKFTGGPENHSLPASPPLSVTSEGPLTIREAESMAVEVFDLLLEVNGCPRKACVYLSSICYVRLKAVDLLGQANKRWIDSCLEELQSYPGCEPEEVRVVQILKQRFG